MEKEELEKLLETNSIQNIARITGISLGSVQYLVIKYGLKSKFNKIGNEDKNKINPQVIPKSSAGGKMLRVSKMAPHFQE